MHHSNLTSLCLAQFKVVKVRHVVDKHARLLPKCCLVLVVSYALVTRNTAAAAQENYSRQADR